MDNNLNDQITENSEGEEKSPSSYTDPNAGYTEAEPQAKNDNSVPKEAADDNLKQEEKSHPAYTYGEMPKSENGSGYGQSAPDGSACHSGTSDGTYENNTYNGNSYYNGTNQLIPMGTLTTSIRIAVIIPDLTRAAIITITIARTIVRCRQSRWIYLHFLPENGF